MLRSNFYSHWKDLLWTISPPPPHTSMWPMGMHTGHILGFLVKLDLVLHVIGLVKPHGQCHLMVAALITVDGMIQSHSDIRRNIWISISGKQGCACYSSLCTLTEVRDVHIQELLKCQVQAFSRCGPCQRSSCILCHTNVHYLFSHWVTCALHNTSFFHTLSTSCLQFPSSALLSRASLQIILSWFIIRP